MNEPLAHKMRPTKLNEVIGQAHLVGKDKVLYNLVKNKKCFSMILYGTPGTGKTSIAHAIINELDTEYRFLNAVINNKKDFDIVIEEAKMYGTLILIMDEIHRLNKDKQDLLLPVLESGLITLIGMTTANPYHKINPAIRSRCLIFELTPLTDKDIAKGLKRSTKYLDDLEIDKEALNLISKLSNGDFRYALNLLEAAYYSNNKKPITVDIIENINQKASFFHDKNEDGHYDVLSAFQKSIRGSDVDASLHYLARLIEAGDFESIYRRMSVIAYEDIGLANPSIGPKVMASIDASERLGMPEARIPLSVVVTEMALSPKSNSAYLALDNALNDIRNGISGVIPKHIKTNSKDYKYPHDAPKYWVNQQYMPDKLKGKVYYTPKNNKYEYSLYKVNMEMKK